MGDKCWPWKGTPIPGNCAVHHLEARFSYLGKRGEEDIIVDLSVLWEASCAEVTERKKPINTSSWLTIVKSKDDTLVFFKRRILNADSVVPVNQTVSEKPGKKKGCSKIWRGSWKSLRLTVTQNGKDELENWRRRAVISSPLLTHQTQSRVL